MPKLTHLQFTNFHPQSISKFSTFIHLSILCTLLICSIFIFFESFLGSVEKSDKIGNVVGLPLSVDGIELVPFAGRGLPPPPPHKTKLIFMLIDAMRYDMVSASNPNMPFLSQRIASNKVVFMKAKSEPPTVTLPRLKALTTGMKPIFLDILKNVEDQSNPEKYSKLAFDNWVYRFHERGAKVVMCGDATWQNLFPTEYFSVIDPTTSLYVHDTVEVDVNVTRNLDWILSADGRMVRTPPWQRHSDGEHAASPEAEWNVTILHYLGLDHVGHVGGIHHPLMAPKQQEMDRVIERIYTWMMQRENDDVMFVVGSDHGMNADGNHGGATAEEVDSFFAFMSKEYDKNPGTSSEYDTVAQRDLVPTLSSLFSLPIPRSSMGKIIDPVLKRLHSPKLTAHAYQENAEQILRLLLQTPDLWRFSNSATHDGGTSEVKRFPATPSVRNLLLLFSRASDMEGYKCFIDSSIDVLIQKSSKIHHDMIVLAWCGFGIASMAILLNGWDLYSRVRLQFQYCYLTAFFILVSHFIYYWSCLKWGEGSEICAPHNYFTVALMVISGSFAMESALVGLRNRTMRAWDYFFSKTKDKSIAIPPKRSRFAFYLLGAPILFQLVSLTASSLIEEEHLIWYYSSATCMVCGFIYGLRRDRDMALRCFAMLLLFSVARLWNQSGIKYRGDADLFKLLSKRNQENPGTSTVVAIVSVLVYSVYEVYAFWVAPTAHWLRRHIAQPLNVQTLLLLLTNSLIIVYKVSVEFMGSSSWAFTILVPQLTYLSLLLMLLVTVIYIPVRENILVSSAHVITRVFSAFICLQFLLQKSENAPLILAINLLCFLTFRAARQGRWNISHPTEIIMFCHMMGLACFYMFGNSISISSIDFSGAYIGFSSFQQEIIGCFIVCMVYAGPIAFDLTTIVSLTHRNFYHTVSRFALFKISLRALTMLIFSIVIYTMRSHLFIWSVFSPKLLHESFLSLYTLGAVLLLSGFITMSMAYYVDYSFYKVRIR